MIRLFLCFFCFSFVFLPAFSYAQSVLFFAPTRLELTDEKPVQEIRVTNMSDIAMSYNISIEDLAMFEDGDVRRVENFEYSAKRMLRFVPRKFDLQPGERQVIRVMGRYPKGTPDGDYHAHLEFLEDVSRRHIVNNLDEGDVDGRARASAKISYMTAIPIVLSKGKVSVSLDVIDLQLGADKKGKPELLFSLLRSGNGQGEAFLEVDLLTPDGQKKVAASRRYIPIYRELDKRNHVFSLEQLGAADLVSGATLDVRLFDKRVSEKDPIKTFVVSVP